MSRTCPNILLLMSDQHAPGMGGFAGGEVARTPNLDRLANRGTVFTSAYCTSPICVPGRASLATGRYVHELGTWDNAAPYTGGRPSWGHRLGAAGYRVTTVGKLHHQDGCAEQTGFPDQRLAMHVHGRGDLRGLVYRDENAARRQPPGDGPSPRILEAGPGESEYTAFDRAVAGEGARFLLEEAGPEPWALMVSLVTPHFPLVAPPEFFEMYAGVDVGLPADDGDAWNHPSVDVFRAAFRLSVPFTDEQIRHARRAYIALCTFMDAQIGRVLSALHEAGFEEDTLVLYTSDHGESAGAHGLWFKHLMNEESVGVPFIAAGPGVDAGARQHDPVSHVDIHPTLLAAAGLEPESDLPGVSLLDGAPGLARRPGVMAEYHANGSHTGSFMYRDGRHKYIEHVGERPQLFDLVEDPGERVDLAKDPAHSTTVETFARDLRELCDPVAVDAKARADQKRRIDEVGGPDAAIGHTVPYTPVPVHLAEVLDTDPGIGAT